jgi:hypothetical protein
MPKGVLFSRYFSLVMDMDSLALADGTPASGWPGHPDVMSTENRCRLLSHSAKKIVAGDHYSRPDFRQDPAPESGQRHVESPGHP